jgi:5-formyltetrahydrofolate cyclo-ligase
MRKQLRRCRRQLADGVRLRAAHRAARQLLRTPLLQRLRHVAVYLAAPDELDTAPLIELLRRRGCRVYVPVVQRDGRLHWLELRHAPAAARRRDAVGMRRPNDARPRRSPRALDAVIVPLLGFDAACHRLGSGGGFYDRNFAFRHRHRGRPRLIGYAFAVQQVEHIPVEPWDVRLDAVVTECGWHRRRH